MDDSEEPDTPRDFVPPASGAGPLPDTVGDHPNAGWAAEYGLLSVDDGTMRIQGDARAYLVQDYTRTQWNDHR